MDAKKEPTRDQIKAVLEKIRPLYQQMIQTNDRAGFKRLLGTHGAYLDSGTKEKLIADFERLAKAWYEGFRKAR
jgi:hypothetical protein